MLFIEKINPMDLSSTDKREISALHRQFFGLDNGDIISYLQKRDLIYLFREKKTNDIVGTLGVQWLVNKKSVVIYLGNVAIRKDYQRKNLLTQSFITIYFMTLRKHISKKIYFCCFMSTPKAFNITKHFPDHFPNEKDSTPPHIKSLMKALANEVVGEGNFIEHKDHILISNFSKKKFIKAKHRSKCYNGLFEKLNPDYENGHQLLTLFRVTMSACITSIFNLIKFVFSNMFKFINHQSKNSKIKRSKEKSQQ